MASVDPLEAAAGLVLLYFLPGFGLARAMFPEWRFRGPTGTVHLLETLGLSLLTSVALTILIGFGLLNSPGGFWSSWSDPVLLAALAAVAAAALLIAAMRGAFAQVPPTGPALEPERGTDGAFEAIRELDGLKAQERRLRHSLRGLGRDDPERTSLGAQIEELETRAAAIVAAREAEERAIE